MLFSLELAKLSIDERRHEGDESRLVSLARQIAACCRPATLRMRIAAAIRAEGDACCPSDQEASCARSGPPTATDSPTITTPGAIA